jgi:hypothetical protein
MSTSFKYVGPHDEVEVPALGVTVKRGETIDTDNADLIGKRASGEDLGSGLYAQPDNWEHVAPKKADKS